jgi:hypothetical protein
MTVTRAAPIRAAMVRERAKLEYDTELLERCNEVREAFIGGLRIDRQ